LNKTGKTVVKAAPNSVIAEKLLKVALNKIKSNETSQKKCH
jgi:hypothetical protein